jgi:hypothetical protein
MRPKANQGSARDRVGFFQASGLRIIERGSFLVSYDEKAAVKWMSWDTNQWLLFLYPPGPLNENVHLTLA